MATSRKDWSEKLRRLIELEEQIAPLEKEAKALKDEIKMAVINGVAVSYGRFFGSVHPSTKYEWDACEFRKQLPGLWIHCAVVDTSKANAFLKAGRITQAQADRIRIPKTSDVFTVKERK